MSTCKVYEVRILSKVTSSERRSLIGEMSVPTTEVLKVREAAAMLAVSENTVRAWSDKGVLRGYRLPGSGFRRFPREEVERLRREMLEQYAPAHEVIDDAPRVRARSIDDAEDLL